ncbi:MAG: hypothetical protein JEZ12_01895 [Desulfobacterium sp.]|nr:hypothetical protein [Desulfobacterium sp.]
MDRITIHTGMAGFHLLTAVSFMDGECIRGRAVLDDPSSFVAMECLAQLGALHVRSLCDFSKHAFLLKVERFSLTGQGRIPGKLALSGNLVARSQAAFSYDLWAQGEGQEVCSGRLSDPRVKSAVQRVQGEGKEVCFGRFVFSVKDYDDRFRKAILRKRYKEIFACLTNGSGIG